LILVLQSFFEICIGIGIGNTFCRVYWYWYCQYFKKVLLTTLTARDIENASVTRRSLISNARSPRVN